MVNYQFVWHFVKGINHETERLRSVAGSQICNCFITSNDHWSIVVTMISKVVSYCIHIHIKWLLFCTHDSCHLLNLLSTSKSKNCVTRAPVVNFIRSWVALSFKVCESVSQACVTPFQISTLCNIWRHRCPLLTQYHQLPTANAS